MTEDSIEYKDDRYDAMKLKPSDRIYSGRNPVQIKMPMLHRDKEWGIVIIAWQDGAMKVVRGFEKID